MPANPALWSLRHAPGLQPCSWGSKQQDELVTSGQRHCIGAWHLSLRGQASCAAAQATSPRPRSVLSMTTPWSATRLWILPQQPCRLHAFLHWRERHGIADAVLRSTCPHAAQNMSRKGRSSWVETRMVQSLSEKAVTGPSGPISRDAAE